MADNAVTIAGNLTADPELRFTPNGTAVASFTIAVSKRRKVGNEWQDELEGFFRCNAWRQLAENLAESLRKGTRVVITGRLRQRSWETREGQKRSEIEIEADDVGPSLKWASATVTRPTERSQHPDEAPAQGSLVSARGYEEGGF